MAGVASVGTVRGRLELEDGFSRSFSLFDQALDTAQGRAKQVNDGMKVVGLAMTGAAAASVKFATDLNKSMANIATLVPKNTERVEELKKAVQDMSTETGKSTQDLAEGLYEVISTFGDGADALNQLGIAARAGSAGLATTQDSLKFLSAVTKTYGDTSAEAMQKVADLGFQTVNLGQTTFPELAAAIGGVAPLAKQTGISLEEMFAIIATATGVTGNTNEVITQMASSIAGLVGPNHELSETYKAMGVASGEALIKEKGLVGALNAVTQAAKDQNKPLIDLLGRKEAWILAASLAGAQADVFTQKMSSMSDVTGVLNTALQEQTQGINKAGHDWEVAKRKFEVMMQDMGDAILNHLSPSLKIAAVGFSELSGQALNYAGQISQVVLAVRSFTTAQTAATVATQTTTTAMGGLTTAAGLARIALVGVGIGIAAWSLAKVYEALSLIQDINRETGENLRDAPNRTAERERAIAEARRLTGIQTRDSIEATQLLTAYSAGLRGEMLKGLKVTSDMAIAFEKGAQASGKFGQSQQVMLTTSEGTVKAFENTTRVINPFAESLRAVQQEVARLNPLQIAAIESGTKLGHNAQEIADAWNKQAGAAKLSEAAITMYTSASKDAEKVTVEVKDDIDKVSNAVANMTEEIDEFTTESLDDIKKVDTRMSDFLETNMGLQKQIRKLNDEMKNKSAMQGMSDGFREASQKAQEWVYRLEDLQDEINGEANPALRALRQELFNVTATKASEEIGELVLKSDEFAQMLVLLGPLTAGLGASLMTAATSADQAGERVKRMRNEITSLKDAFSGEIGEQFGQALVNSLIEGFKSDGISGAFKQGSQIFINQVAKGIGGAVAAQLGTGIVAGIAGSAAAAGAGVIFTAIADVVYTAITEESRKRDQLREAVVARNKLIADLGLSERQFAEMLSRAMVPDLQADILMHSRSVEELQTHWSHVSETVAAYQNQLKGLATAASGAALIGNALGMSTDASKAEQMKSITAMQDAMIDAMKKAGSTSEEIKAQQDKFTEDNKTRVFQATEEQIAQYNRLGTITGGVIANMAGRTGDLIGSIMANKDALQQLIDTQMTFGLAGEATSAATQQVIDLYGYITKNEAAVTSIQGVQQVLNGLGEAFIQNSELANALGGELNAALQSMINNGVATKDAFALAAPALQDLWEVWKDGQVVLDETTVAMLKQAEAQGVVGDRMKDTNEQILDVLTEIRDMFSRDLPQAIQRTTQATNDASNQQQRAHRRTAEEAEQAGRRAAEAAEEAARRTSEATRKLPKDWVIDIKWNVEDPPDVEHPPGGEPGTAHDQRERPPAGGETEPSPNGEGFTPAQTTGASYTTVVVERDGTEDMRYTAENLGQYVRVRAGTLVVGV